MRHVRIKETADEDLLDGKGKPLSRTITIYEEGKVFGRYEWDGVFNAGEWDGDVCSAPVLGLAAVLGYDSVVIESPEWFQYYPLYERPIDCLTFELPCEMDLDGIVALIRDNYEVEISYEPYV